MTKLARFRQVHLNPFNKRQHEQGLARRPWTLPLLKVDAGLGLCRWSALLNQPSSS